MALLLNLPNRNIDNLIEQLNKHIPSEEIVNHTDVKKPDDIKMALVWDHESGSLNNYPNLKGIQSFGAGVDNIISDTTRPNLPIARIIDPDLGINMANYVLTMINHHRLRVDMYHHQQEINLWKPRANRRGLKVGVLGLGNIGTAVAEFLNQAGFDVTGWSLSDKSISGVQCVSGQDAFDKLIADSDYIVCLLPLTIETRSILNSDTFHAMKQSSVLINVARGQHVVEEDLIAALYEKEISAAYLDVFNIEPLPAPHPYWRTPNLTVTPHVSAVTNVDTAVDQIVENYNRIKAGKPMQNCIDIKRGY